MSYPEGRILLNSKEGQVSRFRAWVLLAVPLAAILFQAYVPLFFQFLHILEVPLLVVIYFAIMRRSQTGGLVIGALVGLAQDSLVPQQPLGMYGIAKTLVGYFAASVGMRLDVDHPVLRLLLCSFFYIVHRFFFWVIWRAMLGKPMAFDLQNTLILALLNAVVGVSLFHFLDKLRETA